MLQRLRLGWLTLALMLLTAGFSVASAARMGPHLSDRPEAQQMLLAGATLDQICGQLDGTAHWHCPFCHNLPETPHPELIRIERTAALHPAWQPRSAQRAAAQRANPHASPRAPPAIA